MLVLGIYKALQILLPDETAAHEWVMRPNSAAPFGGRSALERMSSGQVADLYVVRQYLDAQRGGGAMTPSVVCVEWKPCWRIVPSRFPPVQLFERVADPDDLEAVFELE